MINLLTVHNIGSESGLQLIQIAWDMLKNTKFNFGFGEISMATIFFAIIFFNLLGVFIYHIWGD